MRGFIRFLGHCGTPSSREFQCRSFPLQLLQENMEASSQLLLSLHQQTSARSPVQLWFAPFHLRCGTSAYTGTRPPASSVAWSCTASGHMVSINVKTSRHAGFDGITARLWAGIQSTFFSIMWFFFFFFSPIEMQKPP